MENNNTQTYQVIVIDPASQRMITLNMKENTLGALKAELTKLGVGYNNMAFFEGRTCTELLTDQSTFQNDAIFRLTAKEKKITSGAMSRMEAISYIKSKGLTEEVKKANGGKNYTNLSTVILVDFVTSHMKKSTATKAPAAAPKPNPVAAPVENVDTKPSKDAWVQLGIDLGYITVETAQLLFSGVKVSAIDPDLAKLFDKMPIKK